MDNTNMFSLNDAVVEVGSKYLTPGIQDVKVIAVQLKTSKALKPYIQVTLGSTSGATCDSSFSLSTEVNPTTNKSAWNISKNQIFQLASSVIGEKAKSVMDAKSAEEFTNKLAANIVGKTFRAKIGGEEVLTAAGKVFTKAKLGYGLFAESTSVPVTDSKLQYNAERDIKRLPVDSSAPEVVLASPF